MLFFPFTIQAAIISIVLVIVVQLVGSGRKAIDGMPVVGSGFIATLFYASAFWAVTSLMYAGVMAFGSVGATGILLSFIAIYLVMDVGVLIAIAMAAEGCDEPSRRFTGRGCSRSFWLGNSRWALMISWSVAFMYINEMYLPQTWWIVVSALIGMVVCKVRHNVDASYFDDEPGASAAVPSKLWHDFAVYGVQTTLFLAIVLPYTIQSLTKGWGPAALSWILGVAISALLPIVVGAVLSRALPKGEPDYAKLFPAAGVSSADLDDDEYDVEEDDVIHSGDRMPRWSWSHIDDDEDNDELLDGEDDDDEYLDEDDEDDFEYPIEDDEDDSDIVPPRRRRGR
ncbi:MAG: hypothetical protein Q4C83_00850 [Candidatus Saccharibacteria bacterium]|nr:hypothetical protein [Candidatus Saccharibacteria bacterium]